MNLGTMEWGLIAPALAAGAITLSTHVPLGRQVLARGIVFIDLAIAQIAALGVIAANLFGWEPHGLGVQAVAIAAAAAGALLLAYTERRWPEVQEALIGVLFVLAASGALLLLHHNPHGGEHLRDLLEGQILWVGWADLWPVALVYALVLALWFGLGARLSKSFYMVFAVTITLSVQLVGVYLVFASLIIAPLAVRAWPAHWQLPLAYALGLAGYLLGLVLSALLDWPAGATVVWSLAALGLVLAALTPAARR